MSASLTEPMIVPHYNEGTVELYLPGGSGPAFTISSSDYQATLARAGYPNGADGKPPVAAANCCTLNGNDLYVAYSSGNSQSVIKFPGYLQNHASSVSNATVVTVAGNDYVGVQFDGSGNLYAAEGSYADNHIVRYTNAAGAGVTLVNGGGGSYFANFVFDGSGNLWATDYQHNRVVAVLAANLGASNASFCVLNNLSGSIAVANTTAGLNSASSYLLASPEGIAFDAEGNLWVANNNDSGSNGGITNNYTSLVKLTPAFQAQVLAAGAAGYTPAAADANGSYFIYNVQPDANNSKPHLGGLQIDREAGRIFVNEEIGGAIRAYDIDSLAGISAAGLSGNLVGNISVTNPGNGGIALASNLLANIYIRDNLADTGQEPSTGNLAQAPDICYFNQAQTQAQLANLVATISMQPACDPIVSGATTYLYVRLQNAGLQAGSAQVRLYYIQPSSFPVPSKWNYLGTISSGTVVPGTPTVAGPYEWNVGSSVATGHYCFVAIVDMDNEATTFNINDIQTIDNYYDFVRLNNKVTWRNFDIVNSMGGQIVHMSVQVNGWDIHDINSDLEISLNGLPIETDAELKILSRITAGAGLQGMRQIGETTTQSIYALAAGGVSTMTNLGLKKSDSTEIDLSIGLPADIGDGVYDVAVIQSVDGREMGRVTRQLNVGQFPYVGNLRTLEVHQRNDCPWVPEMANHNKTFFTSVEAALAQKYDGCATCLPEYNHG